MKKLNVILSIVVITMLSLTVNAQKNGKYTLHANEVPEVNHVHLDDFPTGVVLPLIDGWGGMAVDINRAPAGSDFSPLLEGLENDKCQVPHWGYVVEGKFRIIFQDGREDIFSEGEAFYMQPGHTGIVMEDVLLVSFSPEHAMHGLVEHINMKVAEMQSSAAE